jgi:tetratricopeptide (TPR) repeat protein
VHSGLPALLVAALAAPGCGRSAAVPRTVPGEASLDQGLRKAYLRALGKAAEGDAAGADRALAPLLLARPLHVPSHLLHQDLVRAAGGESALAGEYQALARSLPADASADVLAIRAVPGPAEARVTGYQAAAVKDPSAPWPRIALATARTDLAADLARRASSREREGFADEGKKLRADARSSMERARTEGERAVALAPDLAAAQAALGRALAETANIAAEEDAEKRDLRTRALFRLGKALSIDPGDPRILVARADVLRDSGRGTEAQDDLDAAAASAPRDPLVLAARARNLDDIHLDARAADAWREAAEAAPLDPDILVDFGSALARKGHWKEALAEYRRADALYADRGGERWRARRGMVTALAQLGLDSRDTARLAEALECLRAYRAEGGPDLKWAGNMAEVLGE